MHSDIFNILDAEDTTKRIDMLLSAIVHLDNSLSSYFFLFSSEMNGLIEYDGKTIFDISDNQNPIIYSYVTGNQYQSQIINTYSDSSTFKKKFSHFSRKKCLIIPMRSIGALTICISSSNLSNKKLVSNICFLAKVFERKEQYYLNENALLMDIQFLKQSLMKRNNLDSHNAKHSFLDNNWVDRSPTKQQFIRKIIAFSQTNKRLLIYGHIGSGKKHLAKLIHSVENVYGQPINIVNCENFDSFTSLKTVFLAVHSKFNIYEQTKEGTLVLENINYLSEAMQERLFNILVANIEYRKIKLIATVSTTEVDKFIVPAFFKEKLVLRDRLSYSNSFKEFILTFIREYNAKNLCFIQGIDDEAVQVFESSETIANVHKLKHSVFAACEGLENNKAVGKMAAERAISSTHTQIKESLPELVIQFEKEAILKQLSLNHWNQRETAKILGLPRRTLSYKCSKYNLRKM